MQPALSDVLTALDRSRTQLRVAVDQVPVTQRDQPPGTGQWSVAGILEHLALVEERLTQTLAVKAAEAGGAITGGEDDAPVLLSPEMHASLIDRSERRQAGEPVQPRGLDSQTAWERAEAARGAFRRFITSANGAALGRIIHEHPRLGALNIYQWAGFLAAHETRHTEQIREIAALMRS